MTYSFQKFTLTNTKQVSQITVTSSSSFGLTSKFCQDINIDQYAYVSLYYDPSAKAIGLHFHSDSGDPHKFKVIKSKKYGAYISASSFFKANDLEAPRYRGRYDWKKEVMPEVGDLYVIDLKVTHEADQTDQPVTDPALAG